MKRVAIIGAGRFGMSLAESLGEVGVETILIDRNGQLIQSAAKTVAFPVQGDATNAHVLEDAGVAECDIAVIAIGSNIEASILATAHCKDLGVKTVVAKAITEMHGKILAKIGADRVIFPDRESARRLARAITGHDAYELLEVSEGLSLAEVDVPEACRNRTLADIDLRKKYGVTVLCIRRMQENPKKPRIVVIPGPNDELLPDDKLIIFGHPKQIDEFI